MKPKKSEQPASAASNCTPRPEKTYGVMVFDMFHYMDEEENSYVGGFPTLEQAKEYARRRTRDSLEEQRPQSKGPADLKDLWWTFGEDCMVVDGGYSGLDELDLFIANPATPEERDWFSLQPPGDRQEPPTAPTLPNPSPGSSPKP